MFLLPMMITTGVVAGVDYEAEVSTLLSGTLGWAIDPSDTATLFTDTGGTTPVATPGVDTVARIDTKFGTTGFQFVNPTATSQSLWNSTYLTYDSIDDWYDAVSDAFSLDMPGCSLTVRGRVSSLAGVSYLVGQGVGAFGQRFSSYINTNGSVAINVRRTTADSLTTVTSAAGLITVGVPFTLQYVIDYAGTGDVTILLDGVSVATGTMAGTPANSENVTPTRSRIGRVPTNTSTSMMAGDLQRIIWARSVLDSTGLANCRGWVEDIAL